MGQEWQLGKTYNHLALLANLDALALDNLDVVQTTENLVLDLEGSNHGELSTLLDLERLVLEGDLASRGGEVDGYGVSLRGFHSKGVDNADSGVVGVGQILATSQAE